MQLNNLSFDEFSELAKSAKRVAVFREIIADQLTPISVYKALSEEIADGIMLETGLQKQAEACYSYLAFDPIAQLQVKNKKTTVITGQKKLEQPAEPLTALRNLIADLAIACKPEFATQITHMAGFISYDAVRLFEDIPDRHAANDVPDILFSFYRLTLTFDHHQHKLLISLVVELDDDLPKVYQAAQQQLAQLVDKLNQPTFEKNPAGSQSTSNKTTAEPDIGDVEFMQLVQRAKQYIISGDAFQIVLSRRFCQQYTAAPFALYRALRKLSPSPYMFYLPFGDHIIVGASPERLIRVQQGKITVHAIAGTRPRNEDISDEMIEFALLNDKKELAEHKMLVDLARNDVGSVSTPGSVKLEVFSQVQHYSHVSHITSVVSGQLQAELDVFAALAAIFPAGTLSGAPKIRAMQIIDELETSRRGIYGGAICRLDYAGNLDSCIAIRMAVINNGTITVRTGAGIVYDSDPKAETQETRQKARAMLEAINLAQGGLL